MLLYKHVPTSNISTLILFSTFVRLLFLHLTFWQQYSPCSSGHSAQCAIHMLVPAKWHYVEEHNNPERRLRWWRNAWYNRQDAFDDVWTSTATSTYNLSQKHITTQQPNTVFGFSPKSINVPNAQTWHLLICRVIYRALKHFVNSTKKKINSVTGSIWVYQGANHLQRAVSCQFCAFNHPQHVALVPNEGNRLHKYDPQKVSCQYFFFFTGGNKSPWHYICKGSLMTARVVCQNMSENWWRVKNTFTACQVASTN